MASRISSLFFQAEDCIRDLTVTGVQTCALPISARRAQAHARSRQAAPPRAPADPPRRPGAEAVDDAVVDVCQAPRPRPALSGVDDAVRAVDRKSVVLGKSVDLGGRRIL